jgi:hypothetical protein
LRLPFSKPRPSRVRTILVPGLTIASVIALAAIVGRLAGVGRPDTEDQSAPAPAPPTGTATSTPDKPAGTELHPPNENFSRQGPGHPQGDGSHPPAKTPASGGKPPSGAGPGQPGITTPKR